MKLLRVTLLGLVLAAPALALAQWQWIDKDGRKVFSDQSPPPDIPAKNILRQPGGKPMTVSAPVAATEPVAAAADAAAPASRPAASAPKLSGKDKQLEDKKKQAEAVAAEKKKAEDESIAKAQADNCARAKQAKASFDSGVRIARTNAKGEREVIDDATRAAETKRLEDIIAKDCKQS